VPQGAQSIEQFAVANSISRTTAYAEIAKGRLKARKIGARTVIIPEDAIKWRRSLPTFKPAA
jgi:hypothetical protein